jgi:hypothetical protein
MKYYFPTEIFSIIKEFLFIDYDLLKQRCNYVTTSLDNKIYNNCTDELSVRPTKLIYDRERNKEYFDYISDNRFVETKELVGDKNNTIMKFIIDYHPTSGFPCTDDIYFFKNLRFEDENIIKYIKNITFHNNGHNFDNFDACFYKTLQKFYNMQGIPLYIFKYGFLRKFSTYGELIITFSAKPVETIKILYDVYKRNNYQLNIGKQFFTYQCSNYSTHNVAKRANMINLHNFSHPTFFFMCNYQLTNIKINLFGDEFSLKQYGQIIRLTNKLDSKLISNYAFNMSRTVPFSQLEFDSPYSDKIILANVNINLIKSFSGYYGMAFRN